ncbi:MAG: hypothetical protein IJ523_00195 [Succinivibrionaceae bacterium]|nr:hypothetical protein [Succinivibrionaceae bacterium]
MSAEDQSKVMRLDEVAGKFIAGDGYAAFLLACLDFGFYTQIMNRQAPLEDAQIIWQHCLDLARYSRGKNCSDGSRLVSFMERMLKEQNQEAFMDCFKFVIVALKKNIDFTDVAQFRISPEIQEAVYAHEEKEGIDNGKYRLLRAAGNKNARKAAGCSWFTLSGLIKFACIVSFLTMICYLLLRS